MPLPTDTLLSQQWHLYNSTPGLLDLNVFGVWNPTEGPAYTGLGVVSYVIDNGFDYNHSDLAPNYDLGADFDFETNTFDAFGALNESHGTAVMGIIGAAANGTGAVGVAFDTHLVGYRTYGFISDAWLQDIRDAIHFAGLPGYGDVMNISQGIANDATSEFGFGYNAVRFDEIETSIGDATSNGRGGLGTTIVKSAGNSRADNYDVNSDDWTNDTRQVVVAAVDQNGFVSSYSSFGAANLVSGFGTPGQVVTTDRVGAAGYNGTDFTSGFNGTSAAAPMVTGVVALMYDANAGLGWRDVQTILGVSARHVGSAVGGGTAGSEQYAWGFNAAATWNGGGQHFSSDYGYGLVDALAAVRLSETWLLTGTSAASTANEFHNTMDVLNVSTVIPDGDLNGLSFSGTAVFDDAVERVTVTMTFNTTFLADLKVYLTSPDGTVSRLISDQAGSADYNGTWTFESQAFRGERAAGTWTVRVVDDAGSDTLTVSDIVIRTAGADTTDDRYIYTNEYSDYDGVFGHATAVTDSNGGIDTVNASAVSSSSLIFLDGNNGIIDGVFTSFTGIENAIGGDAGDAIYGSSDANQLFGMRGADYLYGDTENDTLTGGTGNDTLNGGEGKDDISYGGEGDDTFAITSNHYADNVYGGTGINTLDISGINTFGMTVDLAAQTYQFIPDVWYHYVIQDVRNVLGSIFADSLNGDNLSNQLSGGAGNDTIFGGGGTDSMYGGLGNDVLSQNFGGPNEIMDGGADTDTGDWSYSAANWTIDLNAGTANLAATTYANLTSIENVVGSQGSDTITGDSGANALDGQDGADVINGGADSDTLIGGIGADTLNGGTGIDSLSGGVDSDWYFVDSALDVIDEVAGGGTQDRVLAFVNYTLAADDDIEVMATNFGAATTPINLTGNDLKQTMYGNAGVNVLSGQGGNDTVYGFAGADTLYGGTGLDSLIGGLDSDWYYVDSAGDVIDEVAGGGTADRVLASVSFILAADDDIESLSTTSTLGVTPINLTGNDFAQGVFGNNVLNNLKGLGGADSIYGFAGADTLDGGTGADFLVGGADNDWYYVDDALDVVDENAGGGVDRVLASVSFVLSSNDDIETLTTTSNAGIGAINLTGNGLAQAIYGNAGLNSLKGLGGSDTIFGLAGADTLDGGTGVDSLVGGADSDWYLVDSGADIIDEVIGGGTQDRVLASVTFALAANDDIEILATTASGGFGLINLTGNALSQSIYGNASANDLNGGQGNDTLTGNLGADRFIFNTAPGGTNYDRITDYTVADDTIVLENAIFTGLVGPGLLAGQYEQNLTGVSTLGASRVIYETDTGKLFFDVDGVGGASGVLFAQVTANLQLLGFGSGEFAII